MSDITVEAEPTQEEIAALQSSWQAWQTGNQPGAIEMLRPWAEQDKLWAIAIMIWYFSQQGQQGWASAIPYVEQAVRLGYPFAVNYVVPNMLADPSSRPQALAVLSLVNRQPGSPIDPMGWATQPLQQGDSATAIRILSNSLPIAPYSDQYLQNLLAGARANADAIAHSATEVSAASAQFQELTEQSSDAINQQRSHIETEASQLVTLVRSTSNQQAQTLFNEEAEQSGKEAKSLWWAGLIVFVAAAGIALLPILLHYLGHGPNLSGSGLLSAHIAAATAFGAVAGILLNRSRSRDRTKQRAKDLSVALGTMFVYSNQISNDDEKQQFLRDMGRTILEAHLNRESETSSSEDVGGLISLLRGSK